MLITQPGLMAAMDTDHLIGALEAEGMLDPVNSELLARLDTALEELADERKAYEELQAERDVIALKVEDAEAFLELAEEFKFKAADLGKLFEVHAGTMDDFIDILKKAEEDGR